MWSVLYISYHTSYIDFANHILKDVVILVYKLPYIYFTKHKIEVIVILFLPCQSCMCV